MTSMPTREGDLTPEERLLLEGAHRRLRDEVAAYQTLTGGPSRPGQRSPLRSRGPSRRPGRRSRKPSESSGSSGRGCSAGPGRRGLRAPSSKPTGSRTKTPSTTRPRQGPPVRRRGATRPAAPRPLPVLRPPRDEIPTCVRRVIRRLQQRAGRHRRHSDEPSRTPRAAPDR